MRSLPRLLFLAALGAAFFDTAQAATTRYYGVVQGLRFGCTPAPYQGRANLQVGTTISFLGPNFGASSPASNRTYTLLLTESSPIPGSGRDATISGEWVTTGVDDPRVWSSEPGAIVAGWRDDSLPLLPPSTRRCGGEIYLRGTGSIVEVTRPVGEERCAVDWVFQGQERDRPPRPPRGTWSRDPARVWLRIQADLAATCGIRQRAEGTALPPTVAVGPCADATLCFAPSANAAPELLVRSRMLPGGRVVVSYLPLGVGATEVWSLPVGQPVAKVRSWFLPAAPATGVDHAGFVDLAGYDPPAPLDREGDEESPDEESWGDEVQASAPPPGGPWLSTAALPGFRFKGQLDGAALVQTSVCPKQTICLATAAASPAQVFARVTARQANGKRWVLGGKFADAAVGLWVQRGAAGEIRHYSLAARPADSPWLAALVDRLAFDP